MTNEDFWTSIQSIIANDFSPEGLALLDQYAEQFISRRIVYKRFSPSEQYGCATGGATHVIASLLAAASFRTSGAIPPISDFKIEQQCAEAQSICIEHWAKQVGCWIANPEKELTKLCGEQVAEGGEAHVFYNRTYATPSIYLSDLHDENVIRSKNGAIYVIDCDIRINTPELHQGGTRQLLTDIVHS